MVTIEAQCTIKAVAEDQKLLRNVISQWSTMKPEAHKYFIQKAWELKDTLPEETKKIIGLAKKAGIPLP